MQKRDVSHAAGWVPPTVPDAQDRPQRANASGDAAAPHGSAAPAAEAPRADGEAEQGRGAGTGAHGSASSPAVSPPQLPSLLGYGSGSDAGSGSDDSGGLEAGARIESFF